MTDIPPKRKPGRPKKEPVQHVVEKKGSQSKPQNEENLIEMMCDSPEIFKKIFTLLRSMNAPTVQMCFQPDMISIFTKDHANVNDIFITIHPNELIYYFCEKKYEFGLNIEELKGLMLKLSDKLYSMIEINMTRDDENNKIIFILTNKGIDVIDRLDIDINESKVIVAENIDDRDYPIKFELPSDFLKKKLQEYKEMADTFQITQVGEENLCFGYTSLKGKIKNETIFKDSKKIKLFSTNTSNDIFAVSTNIDWVKPIANSMVSDTLSISACQNRRLVFTAILDKNICTIKVCTKIIGNKDID